MTSIAVARDLGAPLHHQIYLVLADGIAKGRYGAGELLPTEEQLTKLFSVSRITVRRAMASLQSAGLIERGAGRRTMVKPLGRPLRMPMASVMSNIAAYGAETVAQVVEFGYGPAPAFLRERLWDAAGKPVQRAVRDPQPGRRAGDAPHQLCTRDAGQQLHRSRARPHPDVPAAGPRRRAHRGRRADRVGDPRRAGRGAAPRRQGRRGADRPAQHDARPAAAAPSNTSRCSPCRSASASASSSAPTSSFRFEIRPNPEGDRHEPGSQVQCDVEERQDDRGTRRDRLHHRQADRPGGLRGRLHDRRRHRGDARLSRLRPGHHDRDGRNAAPHRQLDHDPADRRRRHRLRQRAQRDPHRAASSSAPASPRIHIEDQVFPKSAAISTNKEMVRREEYVAKIRAAVGRQAPTRTSSSSPAPIRGPWSASRRRSAAPTWRWPSRRRHGLRRGAADAWKRSTKVPKLVKGPCLLNMVRGGKTPEIALDDAERMGYAIAIVPGLLLGDIIASATRRSPR